MKKKRMNGGKKSGLTLNRRGCLLVIPLGCSVLLDKAAVLAGVRRSGCEAGHLTASVVEVKNVNIHHFHTNLNDAVYKSVWTTIL